MAEHTKGPWRADKQGCVVSDAGMICDVGFMNVHPEANARLIAAAPDLLQECKNSAAPNYFAEFASFAQECSRKPSMAIYRQRFVALNTFLRSCTNRSENMCAAIAKAEQS